jgi:RNA polymerase sigma-70 factor (ECF subfamily)
VPLAALVPGDAGGVADGAQTGSFREVFQGLFNAYFTRVFRYLDRASGDPELARDLAQETFLRLYRRGAAPDSPGGWLASVAMNLLRNAKSKEARRRRLDSPQRALGAHSEGPEPPDVGGDEDRRRVRAALDRLPDRERDLLLLRAEGLSYRELSEALGMPETSVGTLLSRAKVRFREALGEDAHAR